VWLSTYFTEEHRAALDWLNDMTYEKLNFYLKIKMNARENQILAELVLDGLEAKPHFCLLRSDRKEIEDEFGEKL
jgi:hypothetical protein